MNYRLSRDQKKIENVLDAALGPVKVQPPEEGPKDRTADPGVVSGQSGR